tara:strand:+ start:49093 stop:50109 length:1017 start_codon:yes stop_codon:yes gene_type:complete
MNQVYWKGKNVLVTGINGFIGGNLTKLLIEKGANVFGLIRNIDKQTFLYFEGLSKQVTLIKGDLVDKTLVERIISEENINVVYHLAAQVEVGVGLQNPYLTFETNIRGTYTLLEAIRCHSGSIESIVIASSDKAYGSYDISKMPYREDYPLIPKYPYDTSKACADMIAKVYTSEVFKLPIIITRFSNIYGPGQLNFSALIPDGIRSALRYSKFEPRGDGSMTRDFIFSEDVADLYLEIGVQLAKKQDKLMGEIFNAGTNSPISIRKVLETIFKKVNNPEDLDKIIQRMKDKKTTGEISHQYMDYQKVNEYFNWSPTHSFSKGIDKTISWYKRYLQRNL